MKLPMEVSLGRSVIRNLNNYIIFIITEFVQFLFVFGVENLFLSNIVSEENSGAYMTNYDLEKSRRLSEKYLTISSK